MKLAQGIEVGDTGLSDTAGAAGYGTAGDLNVIIGDIIQVALGFVGFIFFAYVLYGGFLWMTAQGKEEQVQTATGILKNGIVGLIIISASYAIADYVVGAIAGLGATTATPAG